MIKELAIKLGFAMSDHDKEIYQRFVNADHFEYHDFTTRGNGRVINATEFFLLDDGQFHFLLKYKWNWVHRKHTYKMTVGNKTYVMGSKLFAALRKLHADREFVNRKRLSDFIPRPPPPPAPPRRS